VGLVCIMTRIYLEKSSIEKQAQIVELL